MYVDTSHTKQKDKVYTRHLLRTSYRENGKVKHKTIANLSSCSNDEIIAIKLALKHKQNLVEPVSIADVQTSLGKRIGAAWVLSVLAQRIGIVKALGEGRDAKLALAQVIARLVDQGSRLSAVRFAQRHAVCEILGVEHLNEDDLYANLAWLAKNQEEIEKKLFSHRYVNTTPTLFLYDVTSSYLEGKCNELADWGYNRDKKRGKMQIVVGLLTGPDGLPVAVRVFRGNTGDTSTVGEQIRVLADSFGVREVTLVGDRGMLKIPQIDALPDDFRYITAIAKPQILKMLANRVIQYDLFTDKVLEVIDVDVRYVLRRNPVRARELSRNRTSKQAKIEALAQELTQYLIEHPRAKVETARKNIQTKINTLKVGSWLRAEVMDRKVFTVTDEQALEQEALLDGCYVIKSDVPATAADAQVLHDRYCDLENVERAFRTMKTTHLDMRPVFVRKEESTRGHVFVVMLALLLQRHLEECWAGLDLTVEEGLDELGAIPEEEIKLGTATVRRIPIPNEVGRQLLEKAGVELPEVLPARTASVHTKKKLTTDRLK
jgi:transposase